MSSTHYNYENTIEVLQKIANTTEVIGKNDLMMVMMNRVTEDKQEIMRFDQALVVLRQKLSKLNLKLSLFSNSSNGKEATYVVKSASDSNKKQKENSKETSTVESMKLALNALQANNRKLFCANEQLTEEIQTLKAQFNEEVQMLREKLSSLELKESYYKNVIDSLHALAMS